MKIIFLLTLVAIILGQKAYSKEPLVKLNLKQQIWVKRAGGIQKSIHLACGDAHLLNNGSVISVNQSGVYVEMQDVWLSFTRDSEYNPLFSYPILRHEPGFDVGTGPHLNSDVIDIFLEKSSQNVYAVKKDHSLYRFGCYNHNYQNAKMGEAVKVSSQFKDFYPKSEARIPLWFEENDGTIRTFHENNKILVLIAKVLTDGTDGIKEMDLLYAGPEKNFIIFGNKCDNGICNGKIFAERQYSRTITLQEINGTIYSIVIGDKFINSFPAIYDSSESDYGKDKFLNTSNGVMYLQDFHAYSLTDELNQISSELIRTYAENYAPEVSLHKLFSDYFKGGRIIALNNDGSMFIALRQYYAEKREFVQKVWTTDPGSVRDVQIACTRNFLTTYRIEWANGVHEYFQLNYKDKDASDLVEFVNASVCDNL